MDKSKYSHKGTGSDIRWGGDLKLKHKARSDEELDAGNSFSEQDMLNEGLNQREPFRREYDMYDMHDMGMIDDDY